MGRLCTPKELTISPPMAIGWGTLADGTCNNSGSGEKDSATQTVKVAVHIRPLIASEQLQGCKDCVSVVSGEPQVQIGNYSYTFDHVYGSTASPPSEIFDECVAPLVEGLFHGYNATVLAYGQTGSGKTYTMGTAYMTGGNTDGIIPQVMDMIYKRIETLNEKVQLKVRVSFIEILNEEVHDLLDSDSPTAARTESGANFGARPTTPGKASIQIREATNGDITLAGVTEVDVNNLGDMAALLEQGSLSRATASTNMNSCSSRSHAILTITLQQRHKLDLHASGNLLFLDNGLDDSLSAKLHLVDLAGSERVKRTGADGLRFKEGVHINKGLLALGNVISALGDDKKRKDGGHVPYRDSKLTRLLQDSLGGNSRTVMIACISPADSNAEETLNTLKYANRARNIQNKPIVNRDPMAAEMQRLRQQVEILQAELLCVRAGDGSSDDMQMLKQKITWLEAYNAELRQELQQAREGLQYCAQRVMDALIERDDLLRKLELVRAGKQWDDLDVVAYQTVGLFEAYTTKMQELECKEVENAETHALVPYTAHSIISCMNGMPIQNLDYMGLQGDRQRVMPDMHEDDETAAKEREHTCLQVSMGKELQELNERLQEKEAEMKTFAKPADSMALAQHFEKKLMELEEEKKTLQVERDTLLVEIENLACVSGEQAQKMQETYVQKLKDLESQLVELKQKQDNHHLLKQTIGSDEAAKHLNQEIQRIKAQKVQLQQKIKQESEHFRFWKASREKELQQLKKEGRKNEYELHKLQTLNQRQKMVLQRKTEEAAMATRRLKELLEARKFSIKEYSNASNGTPKQATQKALQHSVDQELELAVHIHEVRNNYEKQTELRTCLAKELESSRQDNDLHLSSFQGMPLSLVMVTNSYNTSGARMARMDLLKAMLENSSSTLVAMASELSEAEERERSLNGRGRWQQLRTMADAKGLLNYVFNIAVDARCQLCDKDLETNELKEKLAELSEMLRQSEVCRKEMVQQQHQQEHTIAKAIATSTKVGSEVSRACGVEEISMSLSDLQGLGSQASNHLHGHPRATMGFRYGHNKAPNRGLRFGGKQSNTQVGKLLRWKRSHERWLMQFKWKWQKPWSLSEWIRHGDESLTRPRPSKLSIMNIK